MSKQIRDLRYLYPPFRKKVETLLSRLGPDWMVIETYRTLDRQQELYRQGRETPGPIVTWTLRSKHIIGLAVDIVPEKDGRPWWDAPHERWQALGRMAEGLGLVWGGRFKSPDCPHVEMAASSAIQRQARAHVSAMKEGSQ